MIKMIKLAFIGATVGCLVISLVELLLIAEVGAQNFSITGNELINFIIGGIIIGEAFALPSIIYEKEDLSLIIQVIVQMGIGFITLLAVGIYFDWIPLETGLMPIITWVLIAAIFGAIFWLGFYLYYSFEAKKINEKIKKIER